MQGYSTKEILKPGFNMPSDYNELVKVYRTLAKSADQRLLRLEEYSKQKNMGNAKQWAYARAMRDIKAWSGDKAERFNTAPPEKKQSLLAKIKDIENFLEKPSSTKQGIKKIYMDRASKVNQEYGTGFTWEDIGDFYESEMYKKLDESYASDTISESIGDLWEHKDEIKELYEKLNKVKGKKNKQKFIDSQEIFRENDDPAVNKLMKELIKDYPSEVKRVLNL